MNPPLDGNDLRARIDALFEGARKIVMSQHSRCYRGDPDEMTAEQVKASMKLQDEMAIIEEFRRLLQNWRP